MIDKKTVLDDDDLIVELEDAAEDFAKTEEDEGVEPFKAQNEAPTVPVEDEEEAEEPVRAKEQEAEPVVADDSYERVTQAEEAARQATANAIWREANAHAQVMDQQRNSARVGIDALALRLATAEEKLDLAEEAGERGIVRQIRSDIEQMRALKGELESSIRALPDPQAIIEQGRTQAQQALAAGPQGRKVGPGLQARHPLAERWAAANGWTKTNSSANNFLRTQAERMTAEGWDPNIEGFYVELGKRVSRAYPNLKVANLQARTRGPGKAQMRTPVAPSRSTVGGRDSVSKANGKTTYTITKSEQSKMRNMRLDPSDPVHRKAWAKQRLSSAREREMERA